MDHTIDEATIIAQNKFNAQPSISKATIEILTREQTI
jgi:hypothetical protein